MKNRSERAQNHHIMHDKVAWSARKSGLWVRNSSGLQVYLDPEVHTRLHQETGPVPVPDYDTLYHVSRQVTHGIHPMKGIDEYCRLVEEAVKRPNLKPLVKELGQLSIEGVRQQIPYIKEGIVENKHWQG